MGKARASEKKVHLDADVTDKSYADAGIVDAVSDSAERFHSMRHGAASSLLADGATPPVVQKQLRLSDPRIRLGI